MILIIIALIMVVMLLKKYYTFSPIEKISYSTFIEEISKGNIEEITIIEEDSTATIKIKDEKNRKQVNIPDMKDFKELIRQENDFGNHIEIEYLYKLKK